MLDNLDNKDSSENASTYTLASLYGRPIGNIAVPQHVIAHIMGRFCQLQPLWNRRFSLYSQEKYLFVNKKKDSLNLSNEEDIFSRQSSASTHRTTQEESSIKWYLTPFNESPDLLTHETHLQSKIKAPISFYVPRPPPAKLANLQEPWKLQARKFAQYFLVLSCPWIFVGKDQGTLPGSLTWNKFCSFVRHLEDGADCLGAGCIKRVRMKWIK